MKDFKRSRNIVLKHEEVNDINVEIFAKIIKIAGILLLKTQLTFFFFFFGILLYLLSIIKYKCKYYALFYFFFSPEFVIFKAFFYALLIGFHG